MMASIFDARVRPFWIVIKYKLWYHVPVLLAPQVRAFLKLLGLAWPDYLLTPALST